MMQTIHENIPATILIVDDSPQNIGVLDALLNRDYIVKVALDGEKALKKMSRTEPPDLVLLDVVMPGMNGFEVCRRLKADPDLKDVPVIFMTALDKPEDEIKGFEAGAVDYITKPINPSTVKARVRTHINLKNAHQLIKAQRDNLEKINQELAEAKETALSFTKAKSEFLANMSHEIRTPMNGVIAATDLALGLNPEPKMKRYLSIIQSSGQSLLGIINDILDFSKIEAGKLVFEEAPFQLDEIFENLSTMFTTKLLQDNKQLEFIIDIQPGIPQNLIGDRIRIQQILTNLLGNSVKFTEKGYIVTGVREIQKTESTVMLEFYVKDTGIGMSRTYMDNLFEAFTQAESSTTRKYGGTGLGLTISKKLLELMKGEIRVESEVGQGTTFQFTLPLKYIYQEEHRYRIPDPIQNLNALIVDDNEEARVILVKYLKSFGFKVEQASLAQEALARLKEARSPANAINLVLIDWLMPELDGIQVVRQIRNQLALNMPVIMISSFGKTDVEKEAFEAGVNFYMQKPVGMSSLYDAIMEVHGFENQFRSNDRPADRQVSEIDSGALAGRKILLAEDNLTNQEIGIAVLSQMDMAVDIANNGRQAVRAVFENAYDLVLMDIQMPELDGYEAARAIRRDPRFPDLPIIAMTAHAMKGDDEKCFEAGMNGYVTKPINQKKLFQTIGKFLKDKASGPAPRPIENENQHDAETGVQAASELDLPGIDTKGAMAAMGLDRRTYKKILINFHHHHQQVIDKLKSAFLRNDRPTLMALAHDVKGSAGNIGARALQKSAMILEQASRPQVEAPPEERLIVNLVEELDRVLQSLAVLDTSMVKDNTAPVDFNSRQTAQTLKLLAKALQNADPTDVNACLDKLTRLIGKSNVKKLGDEIANFDFEQACETLNDIVRTLGLEEP